MYSFDGTGNGTGTHIPLVGNDYYSFTEKTLAMYRKNKAPSIHIIRTRFLDASTEVIWAMKRSERVRPIGSFLGDLDGMRLKQHVEEVEQHEGEWKKHVSKQRR